MRHKKLKWFFPAIILLGLAGMLLLKFNRRLSSAETTREVLPVRGAIQTFISTTGTVLPKNRLEIKPPVNGRVDRILVSEGDRVKAGAILAWMSSTERAALLDAASGKGEETLQYFTEVYKPIPLLAPIDGEVIVAKTQPGQTITSADAVVVLSDRLIVRAQVDETDIGKITLESKAVLSLDAYPDAKMPASVAHIYYESKTVNNVTIYEIDLVPGHVPTFFRSGMNATVDFVEQRKENALLLPAEAVHSQKGEMYVLLKQGDAPEPLKRNVTTGIANGKHIEILSGVQEGDRVIVKASKYSLPKNDTGTNPFMPSRRR